jgi:excisionase family DNA binding protein
MTTMTLLSKQAAADVFGVSQRTIDRLRGSGAIQSVRVGGQIRITADSLTRYIDAQLVPAREVLAADEFPIPAVDAMRAKKAA